MVKLIASTSPFILKENGDKLTPEEFIVYIARVSNQSNQKNMETAHRLIRYLINHHHWSPFEHVSLTFEIKTSRAISAQLLRHRSFTFQEFSQRYSTVTELEDVEWRAQGKTNRQVGDEEMEIPKYLEIKVNKFKSKIISIYDELIKNGVARECARMILPLCTSTTVYMTGSLRSWIHYIGLRATTETQKEHRVIAEQIMEILQKEFPNVFLAMEVDGVYT